MSDQIVNYLQQKIAEKQDEYNRIVAEKEGVELRYRMILTGLEGQITFLEQELLDSQVQPQEIEEELPPFNEARPLMDNFRYKDYNFIAVQENSLNKIINNINNNSLQSNTPSVKWGQGTKHHPESNVPSKLISFIKDGEERQRTFE